MHRPNGKLHTFLFHKDALSIMRSSAIFPTELVIRACDMLPGLKSRALEGSSNRSPRCLQSLTPGCFLLHRKKTYHLSGTAASLPCPSSTGQRSFSPQTLSPQLVVQSQPGAVRARCPALPSRYSSPHCGPGRGGPRTLGMSTPGLPTSAPRSRTCTHCTSSSSSTIHRSELPVCPTTGSCTSNAP